MTMQIRICRRFAAGFLVLKRGVPALLGITACAGACAFEIESPSQAKIVAPFSDMIFTPDGMVGEGVR